MEKRKAYTVSVNVDAVVNAADENAAVNAIVKALDKALAKVSADYSLETRGVEYLDDETGEMVFHEV